MKYLLDSNIVTDLYDKSATDHQKVAARLVSADSIYRELQPSHPDLKLDSWI